MSLRIYGATSGYIELDAPAIANSASVTLPTTNGVLATQTYVDTGVNVKLTPAYGYFGYDTSVTISSGVGVTIPFNTTYLSSGISLSSNTFTFTNAGIYMVDWGCRPGTTSDVWTVIDLHNATTGIVGKSFGFGTIGASDVGARTAHFMAQISNTSVAYTLRMSRPTSSMAIDNPSEAAIGYPETIPAIGLTIWRVG